MKGRTEKKIYTEKLIQAKIAGYPRFIKDYYYSINADTHMTKLRYINNLVRFLDYMFPEEKITLEKIIEINRFDVQEYIENISYYDKNGDTVEMKANTKACIYSSLSSFFNFLLDNEYITKNPVDSLKRPKIEINEVVFLEPEEVITIERKILEEGSGNQTARSKQQDWKLRDFLLFHIPVVNGIRVEALVEINMNDIHMERHTITVTEKGNITKEVFLDDKALRYIRLWKRERQDLLGDKKCDAFFISNRRTRITQRAVEDIIKKYADGINGKHITPHKLRSTFGTNAYRTTKDIKMVADALGHKTTVPTQRYVKSFENGIKDTVDLVASLYK